MLNVDQEESVAANVPGPHASAEDAVHPVSQGRNPPIQSFAAAMIRVLGGWLMAAVIASGPSKAEGPPAPQTRNLAHYTSCGYRELCDLVLSQAQEVLAGGGNLCDIPHEDRRHGLRRPAWQLVDPAQHLDLLSHTLPRIGWQTSQIRNAMRSTMPGATLDQVEREFWRRFGPQMVAALQAGRGILETARIDIDNVPPRERVYRVSVLEPADPNDPGGRWQSIAARGPGVCHERSLLLDEEERTRSTLHTEALFDIKDLFIYRGRTYSVFNTAETLSVYWITRLQYSVGFTPLANVHATPTR